MAKLTTAAWRLMFNELGYAPDFIVSDAGTGIIAAIGAHFGTTHTQAVPSMWHGTRKIEAALASSSRATVMKPRWRTLTGRNLTLPATTMSST